MSGEKQTTNWPLPKFYFSVTFGNRAAVAFQEVSGLDMETDAIEYRSGNNPPRTPIKMPGLMKSQNVTLKKGIFTNDNSLWDWINEVKLNNIKRETVQISLLDQAGDPSMTWNLHNAWPTKISGSDLKSEGNEVAIETLELAYETLTLKR